MRYIRLSFDYLPRGISSRKETIIAGSSKPISANLSARYEIKSPVRGRSVNRQFTEKRRESLQTVVIRNTNKSSAMSNERPVNTEGIRDGDVIPTYTYV